MVEGLIIGPALFLGLLIGAYEAIVIHRDVTIPTHRFGHMIHALVLSVVFVFVSMNVEWVLTVIPVLQTIPILGSALVLRIAIGVIAAIKVHAVSRVVKTTAGMVRGMSESWIHSFLVGGLIIAAPYLYPLIEGILPSWINF